MAVFRAFRPNPRPFRMTPISNRVFATQPESVSGAPRPCAAFQLVPVFFLLVGILLKNRYLEFFWILLWLTIPFYFSACFSLQMFFFVKPKGIGGRSRDRFVFQWHRQATTLGGTSGSLKTPSLFTIIVGSGGSPRWVAILLGSFPS